MTRQVVRDFGTCLSFNGTSAKVIVTSNATIQGMAQLTISLWFKANDVGGSNRKLFFKNGVYDIGLDSSGQLFAEIVGVNNFGIFSSRNMGDNTWHHFVITYDGSTAAAYLDGVSIASTAVVGAPSVASNANDLGFGQHVANGNEWYLGLMDEIRIYNTSLTSAQVTALYYGSEPSSNPVAWWKFDEGSGTSATDSKGSSTGTITNATYSTDVFMKTRSAAAPRLPLSLLTNLVSYWKFDENTGTLAADSVGTNTGTWNGSGSHWTSSGKINAAGVFDGSTDYVNVPNASSLNFTTAVSVSAWVYMTTVNINNQILSKRSAFSGNGIPYELTSTGNPNKFFSWRVIGSGNNLTSTKTVIQANTWYHVVGTWDGTNQIIYLNGEVEASATATGTITANSTPIAIGQLPSGGGEGLTGRIDEVGLWSRGLKEFEVKALYNAGNGNQYGFSTATRAAA